MDLSQDEREQLASLFNGVSHATRIAILQKIETSKSLSDIADDLDVTRGTLQNHIERMIEADLVYRPEETGRTYQLTPFGEYMRELIDAEAPVLVEAANHISEQAEAIEDSLDAAGVSMNEQTRERTVHTQSWEESINEIRQILDDV